MNKFLIFLSTLSAFLFPLAVNAAESGAILNLKMIDSSIAVTALVVFILAYAMVMVEEFTHLRKSKPVLVAAGVIWFLVAFAAKKSGNLDAMNFTFKHTFLEFSELFLFLLVAMTYINSMTERNVFEYLRYWLVSKGFDFRKVFWITGILAFFISPIADNLTTALLMCAVVLAVGKGNTKFISIGCVNIVVAANAGGAFSPFGDITTLMVWQKGVIDFFGFFGIFVPSVVNYIIPAAIMHFAVPNLKPTVSDDAVKLKEGAISVILLFLFTISFTVTSHQLFHLPPVFGMMTGLGFLGFYGFYLKQRGKNMALAASKNVESTVLFDIFRKVSKAEWDTLLFFYGVLMCVGGLSTFGYLAFSAEYFYEGLGATTANILVGILSAIVDNIPVMYAVLTMFPSMDYGQWLLVTLTAGVGGSLLSIGSAAGVALMGQARGYYTFFSHLKWTPAVALGYAASIYVHLLLNASMFDNIPLQL